MAYSVGVVIEARREPLVCHVDKWHKLSLQQNIAYRPPLLSGRIDSRRIVTAGMKQHEVTLRRRPQCLQHGVDVDDVPVHVVIRVLLELQPGTAKQGHVIGPGGCTDPYRRVLPGAQDNASCDSQ